MQLRLNPSLDLKAASQTYARDGLVQIPNILEPHLAEDLWQMLETTLPWGIAFQGAAGPQVYDQNALKTLPQDQIRADLRSALDRTSRAYGFMYLSYPMITAYLQNRDPGHAIHRVTEFIASQEFIGLGARLTRDDDVYKADAQATMYRPGDYIGLHNDIGTEKSDRLAAYTIGLTPEWRPDWGGQLLFHDDQGDVLRGYAPRWNTLTVFKVPRLHSVAPVSAYAVGKRLSIVGWFRNRGQA